MTDIAPQPEHEIPAQEIDGIQTSDTETVAALGGLSLHSATLADETARHLHLVDLEKPPERPSQRELISRYGYRFSDITSPKDLLLREHFEDLAVSNNLPVRNFIRGFHALINGRGKPGLFHHHYTPSGEAYGSYQVREPKPMKGVQIIKREHAHLQPYNGRNLSELDSQIIAQYGAEAGSVLKALHSTLITEKQKLRRETDRALWFTAHALHEQLDKN